MTRDDSGDSAATDNSGRFNKGKWYDGDGDDNDLASAPMAIMTTARMTVRRRYDGENRRRQGVTAAKQHAQQRRLSCLC